MVMCVRMHGRIGVGRLFPAGYPERFDPVPADWTTGEGVVEEMEVVH